ncbi:hypothetical protein GGR52DRAFT_202964 [Hypoxylon sp. FL1284]|nr:hypothetical protein GGR52DRAFT_202964 [Hypoxylon sp. FL1284]
MQAMRDVDVTYHVPCRYLPDSARSLTALSLRELRYYKKGDRAKPLTEYSEQPRLALACTGLLWLALASFLVAAGSPVRLLADPFFFSFCPVLVTYRVCGLPFFFLLPFHFRY